MGSARANKYQVSDLEKILSKEKPINMFKDIALDQKMARFEQKSHERFM